MREIKFRAWLKYRKLMLPVIGLKYFDGENYDYVECVQHGDFINKNIYVSIKEVDIMQFIGLKDKNDKEIYEGDIVRTIDYYNDEESELCEIKYDNISFCISGISDGYRWDPDTEIEIIGNIYENPELFDYKEDV